MPIREEDRDRFEEQRAYLVGVDYGGGALSAEESLEELATLAEAADAVVVGGSLQRRDKPDARLLIGKGKAAEVRGEAKELGANIIIFDEGLAPAQQRNLEEEIDVRVVDRPTVILDIFARRARTAEGRLQVELAQLEYSLPRLRGWGEALTRTGGGIGTRGPGETKLEVDRRRIRRRITTLKRKMGKVQSRRDQERAGRSGVPTVAIVGYTNSGKSTLLNALAGVNDYAADVPFATLDPHVKRGKLSSGRAVLFADTVGFISRLPHDLIAAFRATLEEAVFASALLIVHDTSAPNVEGRAAVVEEILEELGARETPRINLFNKIDMLENGFDAERWTELGFDRALGISALYGDGLDEVAESLDRVLAEAGTPTTLRLPASDGALLSELYDRARVISVNFESDELIVVAVLNDELARRYAGYSKKVGLAYKRG
jgi:GTP-binding protein HflX